MGLASKGLKMIESRIGGAGDQKMRKFALGLAIAGPLLLMASSGRADIVFTVGNHPQADETNILFGAGETGTTIDGFVGASNVAVQFKTLTGETLYQNAQGQADIKNNANPGQIPLTSMDISVPGFTFQDFILNLQTGTGTAHVVATDNNAQQFNYDLGNGQNFLTLTTINGESITDIQITGTDSTFGFIEFKQPRISGVASPGCPPGQTLVNGVCTTLDVPEPASLAILGGALLGLGVARRFQSRTR